MHNSTRPGRRAMVNGVLLTHRQTEKFNEYMETSPTFRKRFMELALQSGMIR